MYKFESWVLTFISMAWLHKTFFLLALVFEMSQHSVYTDIMTSMKRNTHKYESCNVAKSRHNILRMRVGERKRTEKAYRLFKGG